MFDVTIAFLDRENVDLDVLYISYFRRFASPYYASWCWWRPSWKMAPCANRIAHPSGDVITQFRDPHTPMIDFRHADKCWYSAATYSKNRAFLGLCCSTIKQSSAPLIQYRFNPWSQSGRNKSDYGGKDLWKRWVLSLEWNVEAVIGDESEGDDCNEVICTGWGEPGGQWTEWGWRNEEGSWFYR